MSANHTPGLTRDQVFALSDKYGAFEFGDAQGHKRIEFAADVISGRGVRHRNGNRRASMTAIDRAAYLAGSAAYDAAMEAWLSDVQLTWWRVA